MKTALALLLTVIVLSISGCSVYDSTLVEEGLAGVPERPPQSTSSRPATNLCVSYVNDLYSYAKESSAGEFSNLVTVYADAYGMELRDAMEAAMTTTDRVVEEYFEAKAHLETSHEQLLLLC